MRLHLALRLFLVCASTAPLLARGDVPVSPDRWRAQRLPPPPPPDPAWGGIEGRIVKKESKFPVAGVDVTVRGGTVDRTAWTDLDGKYQVESLPPGEYRVTLRWHDATYEHPTPVRVTNLQTLTLDFFAPPPVPPPPPPPSQPPQPSQPPPPSRKPVTHTPEPGSPLSRWQRCRILQAYREGTEFIAFLDKGEADGVRVGTEGLLLDAYDPGYQAVSGSEFTIVRLIAGDRAQTRIKLRSIGKNVDCLLNTARP